MFTDLQISNFCYKITASQPSKSQSYSVYTCKFKLVFHTFKGDLLLLVSVHRRATSVITAGPILTKFDM